MAESAYDELSRRLNYQIPKRIPIIYYATHAEFEQNNIELNFIPEGVGAFAEPARNRMVLPIDLPDEKLQALIQHELTHVFQYEILFGGRLGRALTANVPTWVVEGMASYFGNDEDDKDRMYLRDAVNQDLIPPITKVNIEGYPAYRYGHAVYDFMEAEWGKDAVRDFVFEYRSFLGRDVSVALRRAFEIQPDDFDLKFRRYLRRKYLPLLAVKGEASEYGERFRVGPYGRESFEIGAAPSPSGDFVATLTTVKGDVDIALLSVRDRKLYKNLSAGHTTKYEYIVGQYLTTGPESGRDLSFAPDGDRIAAFGRQERGRKLLIFSARGGGLLERISVAPDVPLAPSWSPDGNSIVFSGIEGNSRDIFLLDMKTHAVRNLTNDAEYDEAPVFSPDGKWIYHSKIVGGFSKIVRFPLDDPVEERAGHVGRQQRRGPVVLAGRQADLLRVLAGRDLQHLRPGSRATGEIFAVHGRDRRRPRPRGLPRPGRPGEDRLLRLPGPPLPALCRRREEAVPEARRARAAARSGQDGRNGGFRARRRSRGRPREALAPEVQAVPRQRAGARGHQLGPDLRLAGASCPFRTTSATTARSSSSTPSPRSRTSASATSTSRSAFSGASSSTTTASTSTDTTTRRATSRATSASRATPASRSTAITRSPVTRASRETSAF